MSTLSHGRDAAPVRSMSGLVPLTPLNETTLPRLVGTAYLVFFSDLEGLVLPCTLPASAENRGLTCHLPTRVVHLKMGSIPLLVGGFSKLFLKSSARVRVEGLEAFLRELEGGRGVLTVSNHVSVSVDEPFTWGTLPLRMFLDSRTTRWTLGASDVMFNGKWDRWFFERGQVIETFRGKGIYQRAIDESAKKLDEGKWVHMYPEGRIKQDTLQELRRCKWGVSRMLMECEKVPLILPIWVKGFEQVMDEPRVWPNYLPNRNKDVTILFGSPLNPSVEPLIDAYRAAFPTPWRPSTYDRPVDQDLADEPKELGRMRSEMAETLRKGLMKLGERVHEVEKGPLARLPWWS